MCPHGWVEDKKVVMATWLGTGPPEFCDGYVRWQKTTKYTQRH